jgi:tight adherence protein C
MIAALVVILVVAGSWRLTAPSARTVVLDVSSSSAAAKWPIAMPAVATGLAAGALVLGGVPGVALLGAIVIGRRWQRVRRERRARRRVEALFPDVIDLFVVAVRAGLLPAMAMQQARYLVAEELRPPIRTVCDHLDDGATFAEALTTLVTTVGTTARPFVDAVVSAERYGLPLAPVLDRLTVEAREQRRRDGQAAARELPIRLAAPLVLCTLPSFALLAIAPLLLGALSSLHL